ncbi:MAG: MBL fold metallo-hydrolase [Chloroflexota bacterium]
MISRRNILKAMGVASLAAAFGVQHNNRASAQATTTLGSMFVTQRGPVTLHTYIAPDSSAQVNAHVIETANRLVVVDTQWLQTYATDFRAYVDSIGKPIERVILSHEHPDHWAGGNQFADVPFVTTPTIAETAEANADFYFQTITGLFGESEVPETPNVPEGNLTDEREEIDGVTFEYRIDNDAEAVEHLSIHLPQANTWIVQDLIYNNTHFFPGMNRVNWIATLESLAAEVSQEDLLLVGHGLPTSKGEIDSAVAYLRLAEALVADASDSEAIISALQSAYPSHGGPELLGFWPLFVQ